MSSYLQRYAREIAQQSPARFESFRQYEEGMSNSQMVEQMKAVDASNDVELCKRVTRIPVAEQIGLKHWWLRTDTKEMGMGSATGEVPGRSRSPDVPFTPTTLNDHTGQGDEVGSVCIAPVEQNPDWAEIDVECVEREMKLGKETGPWTPLVNDCQTWASSVLDRCALPRPGRRDSNSQHPRVCSPAPGAWGF